ncbi:efflux RND transporter periplasmic adaptor subunit [Dechloromonas sp. HYN0024]|uniref:efflux RND transporter periplasmic adaptor subunit n=1 Tax=Dechloromonas sp. HYN0024 TaxID=2231055 RepID=UPI000E4502D3|nr:HlyD family efflux transporter periplasmic adaptor subunit [Dechloromonas sp. HYN0024]AXS79454.1 HlyD family efflux transporter periplasmic adaptor subunit [Dechloromonas sp. HYN0024]
MAVQDLYTAFLDLSRRARRANDVIELGFIAVNDTHLLAPYRQAALWFDDGGVRMLSGVLQPEANAPYVHWLKRVCRHLLDQQVGCREIQANDLPGEEADEWSEWLPAFALWFPLAAGQEAHSPGPGGLLLARDTPWQADEIALLTEWIDVWRHAWHAHFRPDPWSWRRWRDQTRAYFQPGDGQTWWQQRRIRWAAVVAIVLLLPVRLTVLAPGELVPSNPAMIRAPLDGVVGTFFVKPNESVKQGQALFDFDQAPLVARSEVATQSLATAEAEYRQFAQQALSDAKSKAQLAIVQGKIEERKAEANFLHGQLERSHVTAPQDGIALFDDPTEWIGKPVVTGERIMRIAAPDDVEIEAWLPVGDAIPLEPESAVSLYLNASPLFAVSAAVRYAAHDAVLRPDGSYAYRVRARLDGQTGHRVGLKGTAKLSGGWVPLFYWVLRRPLASLRQMVGL